MNEEKEVRSCGASYQYCDGECIAGGQNARMFVAATNTEIKAFPEDDGVRKPTKEQYEKSKKLKADVSHWIRESKKRQEALIDQLCKERACEKDYTEIYEAHRDVVRRYEIYEEIESNG